MLKKTTPARRRAEKAITTLVEFGKDGLADNATRGQRLGYALYAFNDPSTVVDAAMEALEQWNGHLSVAVLAAIERGQGKVTRQGPDCYN